MPRDLTVPSDYAAPLTEIKAQVRAAQTRAHRVVNTELLQIYWQIGHSIRTRQDTAGWARE